MHVGWFLTEPIFGGKMSNLGKVGVVVATGQME